MKFQKFQAKVTFDEEFDIFHGEVINTRDVITFQGSRWPNCAQPSKTRSTST